MHTTVQGIADKSRIRCDKVDGNILVCIFCITSKFQL